MNLDDRICRECDARAQRICRRTAWGLGLVGAGVGVIALLLVVLW